MGNKNCRIGWICNPSTGIEIRLTIREGVLCLSTREKFGEETTESVIERKDILRLYGEYPYHPVLRTMRTRPPVETVRLWDRRTNKDQ